MYPNLLPPPHISVTPQLDPSLFVSLQLLVMSVFLLMTSALYLTLRTFEGSTPVNGCHTYLAMLVIISLGMWSQYFVLFPGQRRSNVDTKMGIGEGGGLGGRGGC